MSTKRNSSPFASTRTVVSSRGSTEKFLVIYDLCIQGRIQGGAIVAIAPLKPTNVTLFTIILISFGKQHSRLKATLSSIVLSQQCCEVYFISLTVTKLL